MSNNCKTFCFEIFSFLNFIISHFYMLSKPHFELLLVIINIKKLSSCTLQSIVTLSSAIIISQKGHFRRLCLGTF